MNDQNQSLNSELPNIELINGDQIGINLHKLKLTKPQQPLSVFNAKKNKKAIEKVNEPSAPFYNELHYGNYE